MGGSTGELNGSGTVNTSGTAVTSESGTGFSAATWTNLTSTFIVINGVAYAITSVNSSSSITLASSAGTQTGVAYFVVGSPLVANDPYTNQCFGFNLTNVRIANFYVGMQWGSNSWSQAMTNCSIYDNYVGVIMHGAGNANNSGENISFINGLISNNTGGGLYLGSGATSGNSNNAAGFNVNLVNVSLDQNGGWAVQNGLGPSGNYISIKNCYIFTGTGNPGLWIRNFGNMLVSGCYFNSGTTNTTYSIDNECQYSFTVVGCVMYYGGSGVALNPAGKASIWIGNILTGASGALNSALVPTLIVAGKNIQATALAANFNAGAAWTLFTPSAAVGQFLRVNFVQEMTQAATSSSTFPSLTLGWTDAGGIARTAVLAGTSAANNPNTDIASGSGVILTNGSTPVTVTSASYASSGATPMQYALAVSVELV